MSLAPSLRLALLLSLVITGVTRAAPRGVEHFPLLQDQAGIERATVPGEEWVREEDIRETLAYLAADDKLGRKPGSAELEATVFEFLATAIEGWGLQPAGNAEGSTFLQPFKASSWWPLRGESEPDYLIAPERTLFCSEPDEFGFLIDAEGNPLTLDHSAFLDRAGRRQLDAELRAEILRASYDTHNFAAMLPGNDPDLANEVLVLGAHIDHIGHRGDTIYNGADDNASGSAVLLSLARAFSRLAREGKGPARSILFLWFSAEEMGLLGSQYWVRNPTIPLERVAAMLNMDMLGRSEGNEISLYDGSSEDKDWAFHDWHDTDSLAFPQVKHDIKAFVRRSDQYPFYAKGIPVMFFFEGFVGDSGQQLQADYHRPTDTAEKIDYSKLARAARFIFRHAVAASLPLTR